MGNYPDCNRCPSVNKKLLVCPDDWLEVARSPTVDLDDLLRRLRSVEGDKSAEEALFAKLQSQGACMIVTVVLEEPNDLRMLKILKYLRALFAMKVWSDEVRLVKADENRFFIFAVTAGRALKAAVSMSFLVAEFDAWIGNVCPDIGPLSSPPSLKAGIHGGAILLIEGDCFGDPVNVASKLGEDTAKPKEILVSATSAQNQNDEDMNALRSCYMLKPQKIEISGLILDYFVVDSKLLDKSTSRNGAPSKEEVEKYLADTGKHNSIETAERVILTTDMSGFTRLTKTYGILHFLRLVLSARNIMVPAFQKVGGRRVKYEGDNIIAAFPSVDSAVLCIKSCAEQIAVFNRNREKDFQIRIGYALDVGVVRMCYALDDIIGAAFDCSFQLAEDVAEVGEVLVTERVKLIGWPSIRSSTTLRNKRTLKSGDRYYALSFE